MRMCMYAGQYRWDSHAVAEVEFSKLGNSPTGDEGKLSLYLCACVRVPEGALGRRMNMMYLQVKFREGGCACSGFMFISNRTTR